MFVEQVGEPEQDPAASAAGVSLQPRVRGACGADGGVDIARVREPDDRLHLTGRGVAVLVLAARVARLPRVADEMSLRGQPRDRSPSAGSTSRPSTVEPMERFAARRARVRRRRRHRTRAVAQRLATEGAAVACLDRDHAEADETASIAAGASRSPIECDITDADACVRAVAATVDRFGRLDVLVNAAGIAASHTHHDVSRGGRGAASSR